MRKKLGKKQFRFAEMARFSNVLQKPEHIKGKWNEEFDNSNDIVLELACGKGEYTIGQAEEAKSTNFIGLDIKGNRMYIGAKKALDNKLSNVRFLRIQIQKIESYFAPNEVAEMWITFSDPFLRKASNRLTHSRFLKAYQNVMKEGGKIHLKTDSVELYDYTKEMIELHKCDLFKDDPDVYAQSNIQFPLNIKTFYEKMHLEAGLKIHYLCFSLPKAPIVVPPKQKKNEEEAV